MVRKLFSAAIVAGVLAAASDVLGATRVVVLPFAGVSPAPQRDAWIGGAVQQNMIMALGQSRGLQPVAYAGKVTGMVDATVAARAATASQGELAVFGTYEVVGEQVRLTAQLVDASGQSLGAAKVIGGADRLLSLEDELADQIRTAVGAPQAAAPAPAATEAAPANLNAAAWTPVDAAVYSDPYPAAYSGYYYSPYRYLGYGYASPYAYTGYPWGYSYPYWGWGWSIGWGGCWVSFGDAWEDIHDGHHGHHGHHGSHYAGHGDWRGRGDGRREAFPRSGRNGDGLLGAPSQRPSSAVSPQLVARSSPSFSRGGAAAVSPSFRDAEPGRSTPSIRPVPSVPSTPSVRPVPSIPSAPTLRSSPAIPSAPTFRQAPAIPSSPAPRQISSPSPSMSFVRSVPQSPSMPTLSSAPSMRQMSSPSMGRPSVGGGGRSFSAPSSSGGSTGGRSGRGR